MVADTTLDPYLRHLDEVDGISSYQLLETDVAARAVRVRTPVGSTRLIIKLLRSHLSQAVLAHLAESATQQGEPLLVLAPHIGAPAGARLSAAGAHYLDRAGNCHLELDGLHVHIEGRSDSRAHSDKGIRRAGYQVLFVYLAAPELLDAPLRTVASAAGVSRQAVADMRRRLLDGEYVVATRSRRRWVQVRRDDALNLWLHGYDVSIRPAMLLGIFRTPDATPQQLQERLRESLFQHGIDLRWGGSTAAFEISGHYRGELTTVHLPPKVGLTDALRRELQALADPRGDLTLMTCFGETAWNGALPHVHPLLVYSELLHQRDERAHEAARRLYTDHVLPLWSDA
jgi:hypothetical protein